MLCVCIGYPKKVLLRGVRHEAGTVGSKHAVPSLRLHDCRVFLKIYGMHCSSWPNKHRLTISQVVCWDRN